MIDFSGHTVKMTAQDEKVSAQVCTEAEVSAQETQEASENLKTIAHTQEKTRIGAPPQTSHGDHHAQAYADSSPEDRRAKLIYSLKTSYPILDQCMQEAAVDMFLRYPNLTPDEILAEVPSTYFLDNIPVVTVPELTANSTEHTVAGVASIPDEDSEGHSRESESELATSPSHQTETTSDAGWTPGKTLQG